MDYYFQYNMVESHKDHVERKRTKHLYSIIQLYDFIYSWFKLICASRSQDGDRLLKGELIRDCKGHKGNRTLTVFYILTR